MIKHLASHYSLFESLVARPGLGKPGMLLTAFRKYCILLKMIPDKINAQIGLCRFIYRLGNTDSALFYGQQALKAAEKINYLTGQVSARGFMAVTLEQLGDLPETLGMAFKAIQIAKENNIESKTTPALNAIGETYIILKEYPKAIFYFRMQQILDEKAGSEGGTA